MHDGQPPAVPPRYVDGRRLLRGAMRVGVDLVALLVVDSLASRVAPATRGQSPLAAPATRLPTPRLPERRRLELVRPA